MRKGVVLLGLLGLTLVWSGGGAYAQTVFTYSPAPLTIPLTPTNWNPQTKFATTNPDPFLTEQFDPSKFPVFGAPGKLVGVELHLDYRFDNRLTMRFDNVSTISVEARGTVDVYLPDKPANATSPVPLPGFTKLVPTGEFTNQATMESKPSDIFSKTVMVPSDGTFKSFPGSTSSVPGGYTDPNILAAFTGKGSLTIPVYATATSSFTSLSGNGAGTSEMLAMATVRVVYYYVPEPSSLALFGLGALGLAWAGRGRARSLWEGSRPDCA